MKEIKKKMLGILSTMTVALACGGVAIVSTSAEDGIVGTITMHTGASVSLGAGYGGIRWKTYIDSNMWKAYGDGAIYGTLIYPVTETDVTIDNAQEKGARIVWADATKFTTENESRVFYSAVSYDNIVEDYKEANNITDDSLDEQIKEAAYKLELKAVSFIKTSDGYVEYAPETDTARSARQVAIAADLKNDTDKITDEEIKTQVGARISAYELGALVYKNEQNAAIYELQSNDSETKVEHYEGGEAQEVLIGAKKISGATVEGTTVTLPAGVDVKAGEGEFLSVIGADGTIYSTDLIVATDVLTTAEDLTQFGTGTFSDSTTWKVQTGYYVLGNDIDASTIASDWSAGGATTPGAPKLDNVTYKGKIGFAGTLNGMGYTIDKLNMRSGGLFGYINCGTIKNVAFTNIQSELINGDTGKEYCGLATYATNGTFENVYIHAEAFPNNSKANLQQTGIVTTGSYQLSLKGVVIVTDLNRMPNDVYYKGSDMFGVFGSNASAGTNLITSAEQAYVISAAPLAYYYSYNTSTTSGTGSMVDAENTWYNLDATKGDLQYFHFEGATTNASSVTARNITGIKTITGVKRYLNAGAMLTDNNEYTLFNDEYWDKTSGIPVWRNLGAKTVSVTDATYVDEMFSVYDGDIDVKAAFGAQENDAVVLISATQEGNDSITVTNGKLINVKPNLVYGTNGGAIGVGYTTVTLSGTVNGENKTAVVALKAYTRVIDELSDLTMFNIGTVDKNVLTAGNGANHNGYYIMKNDLVADSTGFTVASPGGGTGQNASGFGNQTTNWGLTGTFDGNGCKIDGVTFMKYGLFGHIKGGVVKNVAFVNTKFGESDASVLAAYIMKATVENVYIQMAALPSGAFSVVALDIYSSNMRNILVDTGSLTTSRTNYYGSYAYMSAGAYRTQWIENDNENIYVISKFLLGCYSSNNTDAYNRKDEAEITTAKYFLAGIKRFDAAADVSDDTVSFGYWTIANDGTITWAKTND